MDKMMMAMSDPSPEAERGDIYEDIAFQLFGTRELRSLTRPQIKKLNEAFDMFMENNLWFHYLEPLLIEEEDAIQYASRASVKALTDTAQYELWHHRLGHPGKTVTELIHKHVEPFLHHYI